MPRSRRGLPRPEPREPDPEIEEPSEWGGDPEDVEDAEGDPGEPPSLPAAQIEPAAPPSAELAALGAPPADTLAAEKWAHSVLMRQAYETMMSDKLNETQRRREVRTILRDAKGHVTDAARYDYMRLVEREKRELDDHKRGRAGAVPVSVGKAPAAAKIIPLIPRNE